VIIAGLPDGTTVVVSDDGPSVVATIELNGGSLLEISVELDVGSVVGVGLELVSTEE